MTDHITLPRSTVEQAIEALETWIKGPYDTSTRKGSATRSVVAIEALRAALAAQQAEPVVELDIYESEHTHRFGIMPTSAGLYLPPGKYKLYTAPQPAQPVAQGWKLVPVEPTPEMCRALFINLTHADDETRLIKAVLAAAPTPPAATVPVLEPWQPIETAPKDGQHVLICRATNADGKPIVDSFGLFVHRAAWWDGDEEWIVYNSQIQEMPAFFEPTHWMPIPQPPVEAAKLAKRGGV